MKISTIIPVYNTSKYLKKCIESVINQTIGFKNIELIVVNDGSIDDSEKIIKEYQKKYKNIKYIYQKNGGQASARNNGLKEASGEYISFVDSDDWIDKDMYLDLYNSAKNKYDIVTCDYTFMKNTGSEYVKFKFTDDSNNNFIIMNTGPCNMIINRNFLIKKSFKFPRGIIYEDLAIIPSLGIGSKIYHIEKSYYNYLSRENSTMNIQKYSKKLENIFDSFEILCDSFKLQDRENLYNQELEFLYIRRLLMSASLRFISYNDPNNCINKISNIMKEKYPDWKKNKYYKKLPFKQKLVAIFAYRKNKIILKMLYNLNNYRKK